MSSIAIIGCIVGVVSCLVGVMTFASAQITKANQNGRLLEKIEYACKGIDEIKKDMKTKNKEIDETLEEHAIKITKIEQQIKTLFDKVKE